jgi:hypothetical protein
MAAAEDHGAHEGHRQPVDEHQGQSVGGLPPAPRGELVLQLTPLLGTKRLQGGTGQLQGPMAGLRLGLHQPSLALELLEGPGHGTP